MKHTEQLAAINGTENDNKEITKLIEYKPLEGTPFTVVKRETGVILTMGKYQISPELEQEEEIPIWIMENEWNLITTISIIVAEDTIYKEKGKSSI